MSLSQRSVRLAAIVAVAVGLAGCVYAPIPNPFSEATQAELSTRPGRNIVAYRCAYCHSVEGALPSRNPDAPRFVDLRGRYDSAALAARLADISTHGHGRMPPYQFAPSEIEALVDYIRRAK